MPPVTALFVIIRSPDPHRVRMRVHRALLRTGFSELAEQFDRECEKHSAEEWRGICLRYVRLYPDS